MVTLFNSLLVELGVAKGVIDGCCVVTATLGLLTFALSSAVGFDSTVFVAKGVIVTSLVRGRGSATALVGTLKSPEPPNIPVGVHTYFC